MIQHNTLINTKKSLKSCESHYSRIDEGTRSTRNFIKTVLRTTKQRLLLPKLEKAPDARWSLLLLFVLVAIICLDVDITGNVPRLLHGFVAITLHLTVERKELAG